MIPAVLHDKEAHIRIVFERDTIYDLEGETTPAMIYAVTCGEEIILVRQGNGNLYVGETMGPIYVPPGNSGCTLLNLTGGVALIQVHLT